MGDNDGLPPDLGNELPAFMRPREEQPQTDFIGLDVAPEFDAELAPCHAVSRSEDQDYGQETQTPAGKGPSRGYQERHRAIARLHALGHTSNQIGRKLGYSPTGVSLALKNPWVQAEVARYRAQYETDIASRVKDAALDGIDRIHAIIRDDTEKSAVVLDASKWAVEKVTGKPRQEVSVESGTLSTFMEMLKAMRARGESVQPIDVTPQALPEARRAEGDSTQSVPQWNTWLDQNLG